MFKALYKWISVNSAFLKALCKFESIKALFNFRDVDQINGCTNINEALLIRALLHCILFYTLQPYCPFLWPFYQVLLASQLSAFLLARFSKMNQVLLIHLLGQSLLFFTLSLYGASPWSFYMTLLMSPVTTLFLIRRSIDHTQFALDFLIRPFYTALLFIIGAAILIQGQSLITYLASAVYFVFALRVFVKNYWPSFVEVFPKVARFSFLENYLRQTTDFVLGFGGVVYYFFATPSLFLSNMLLNLVTQTPIVVRSVSRFISYNQKLLIDCNQRKIKLFGESDFERVFVTLHQDSLKKMRAPDFNLKMIGGFQAFKNFYCCFNRQNYPTLNLSYITSDLFIKKHFAQPFLREGELISVIRALKTNLELCGLDNDRKKLHELARKYPCPEDFSVELFCKLVDISHNLITHNLKQSIELLPADDEYLQKRLVKLRGDMDIFKRIFHRDKHEHTTVSAYQTTSLYFIGFINALSLVITNYIQNAQGMNINQREKDKKYIVSSNKKTKESRRKLDQLLNIYESVFSLDKYDHDPCPTYFDREIASLYRALHTTITSCFLEVLDEMFIRPFYFSSTDLESKFYQCCIDLLSSKEKSTNFGRFVALLNKFENFDLANFIKNQCMSSLSRKDLGEQHDFTQKMSEGANPFLIPTYDLWTIKLELDQYYQSNYGQYKFLALSNTDLYILMNFNSLDKSFLARVWNALYSHKHAYDVEGCLLDKQLRYRQNALAIMETTVGLNANLIKAIRDEFITPLNKMALELYCSDTLFAHEVEALMASFTPEIESSAISFEDLCSYVTFYSLFKEKVLCYPCQGGTWPETSHYQEQRTSDDNDVMQEQEVKGLFSVNPSLLFSKVRENPKLYLSPICFITGLFRDENIGAKKRSP